MKPEKKHGSARDLREEAIVCVAAELFLERGIDEVKMTDIAQRAEVGVASVYRYFGSKDNLVVLAGEFLWNDLQTLFRVVYENEDFRRLTGMEQISSLFGIFRTLFHEHPAFIRFLGEFDAYVVREKVSPQKLEDYEKSVLNFFPVFLQSYDAGIRDGSVRPVASPRLFYESVCHAAMALTQKLLRGDILAADVFRNSSELDYLLTIFESYLRKG